MNVMVDDNLLFFLYLQLFRYLHYTLMAGLHKSIRAIRYSEVHMTLIQAKFAKDQQMIAELLTNHNSVLVQKTSVEGSGEGDDSDLVSVARFTDKPLGAAVQCSAQLKDACDAFVRENIKLVLMRETLESIAAIKPTATDVERAEVKSEIEERINSVWDNVVKFISGEILKTKQQFKNKTMTPPQMREVLENRLSQLLHLGTIAISPYTLKEKTGMHNLVADMKMLDADLQKNPDMNPLERKEIVQRSNAKLLKFSNKINENSPSGYLKVLCEKLIARMSYNIAEIQKNRVLNGSLLETQLDNEIKKFDKLYNIIMDIYRVRENYNPKMPSSDNDNQFYAFKANPDRKAVILWLENRLKNTANIIPDKSANIEALSQNLISDLQGAKIDIENHHKSIINPVFYLSRKAGKHSRLADCISDVVNRHTSLRSAIDHRPTKDVGWQGIIEEVKVRMKTKGGEKVTNNKLARQKSARNVIEAPEKHHILVKNIGLLQHQGRGLNKVGIDATQKGSANKYNVDDAAEKGKWAGPRRRR
jgi:hypothetical protein